MLKRLVIFVEGNGDVAAVPTIAKRVVRELAAHDVLFVDPEPFRIRGVSALVKNGCADWHRWLNLAGATRSNIGAVLLVLDGDLERVPSQWATHANLFGTSDFCAFRAAAALGQDARRARAGEAYSLASVFAMKEFEAWLLAGIQSLRGKALAEDRGVVPADAACPEIDIEQVRDAKGRLRRIVPSYDETLDQDALAGEVHLETVRQRCRSFRRFCAAIRELADAVRNNTNTVTPAYPAAFKG